MRKKYFLVSSRIPVFCIFIFSFLINLIPPDTLAQSSSLFEHFSSLEGLPSDKVYDVTQTSDGNIWFATSKGISRFDGMQFHSFNENNGLTELEITGINTDPNGKIWCWSSTGRIFYFENNFFFPVKNNAALSTKLDNKIINSLSVEKNGDIWIVTVIPGDLIKIRYDNIIEQISMSEKINVSFFIKEVEPGNFVFGSLKSNEENNQLAVFVNTGVFAISLSEKGNFSKSSFFPLPNEEYLFAKGQEIIHFKTDKIIQRSFTEKNVQDIIKDSEGKIWAGLYLGGVLCYPEGKLNSSGMVNYFGNKSVSSILEDNSGNIWFTTMEDGVYYLPVRSKLIYSSPIIFSQKGGIRSDEKPKAVTLHGLSSPEVAPEPGFRVISTDTSFLDTVPPSIFISGLKIMELDTSIHAHYDLPFDKNFLKIHFAGFAYSDPEALKYKYKMDGIDKIWIYTDNTFVQYTTLPAGRYLFTVSAMNKNGVWSDTPAVISFTIEPPYWRTWWFISLLTAFMVGLVVLFFFVRVSQIKRREKEKAEITRQMANAELQALRAQMNPHFIFNTLSSIQYFITKNETEGALKYLSKFAKLMRKIMDNSKKSAILLKDEIEALQLYLDLESLRFKNKFDFNIQLDDKIDMNEDEIPPMLIQPYIENAILHGLMNKDLSGGKGTLLISIRKLGTMIVCSIEDNGIGRERSKEINSTNQSRHISSGMSITKSRLEILNSMNQSNLSINITDLKNGKEAIGTRVEIFIPL